MNFGINGAGIFISVGLIALALQSIATQEEGIFPGHQVLFWVAFFAGCFILAWFTKRVPSKGPTRSVIVFTRRRLRRLL